MVKTRRRRSSQGDDVSLLDDPDESPPRYSMQASNGGSSSIRKSKSASNNRRSGEAIRSSALPPENRFVPQHDPKAEARHVPRQGALQFVPAYEESTSPVISTQPGRIQQQEEAPAPTWDAIIEADGGIRGRSLSWGRKQKAHTRASKSHSAERSISSVESAGTGIFRRGGRKIRGSPVRSGSSKSPGSKRPLGTALPRTSVSPAKQRQSETSRGNNVESASAISAVSSSKKGKRIGRLASLFSSKAREDESPMLTPETKRPLMRKDITPVSPARSESSNDYSGWPGTQDKRGGVVAIQSSYDDSSVGAAGVSTFHRKKYELEMDDDAVEEEVRKWMNDPSFDDSTVGTDPASPQRKPKKNVSYESRGSSRNVSYESKGSSRNISYESSKGSSRHSSFESSRIMSEQSFTDEDENPADFHLAALVANAAPRSPLAENTPSPSQSYRRKLLNGSRQKTRQSGSSSYASFSRSTKSSAGASSVAASSATGALSMNNLFGDEHKKKRNSPSREVIKQAFNDDPWEMEEYEPAPSSAGTSVSKSSSAFFQTRGVSESRYGIRPNMRDGASTVIRRKSKSPTKPDHQVQPPTEEALARNERYSAAQRGVNASNIRGYRGYLDKTKDVPNLMDALDSESASSSKATSAYIPSNLHVKRSSSNTGRATPDDADEEGSDIFDGLSATGTDVFSTVAVEPSGRGDYNDSGIQEKPKGMNVVRLAGGLTAIQTTQSDLDRRGKAHDFDENLTNSSVDNYGYTKLPAFREMAVSGRKSNDTAKYIPPSSGMVSPTGQPIRAPISTQRSGATPRNMFVEPTLSMSESGASAFSENAHLGTLRGYYHGDLSEYCVNPRQAKQLVKRYREVSAARSKYLSREQLSKEEDAKKAFALLEMRSRVMEKDIERGLERQGGTVPVDDLVTTPYNQAAHRVRDAVIVSKAWRDGASPRDVVTAALLTRAEERTYCVKRPLWYIDSHQPSYYLEPVTWLDDTDFMQLRCPSLGPRCMRGFEIFTIGDCQSILLKLTNERCMVRVSTVVYFPAHYGRRLDSHPHLSNLCCTGTSPRAE